jgi:hypothetical protein
VRPFLETVTPLGAERVRLLRDAQSAEEMKALIQQLGGDLATALSCGPVFTPADEYVFAFALAIRTSGVPRASAASFDGAAQVALSARAFHEALLALERAEEARPCPKRRKQITELRRALLPVGPEEPGAPTHARRRRRRTRRT